MNSSVAALCSRRRSTRLPALPGLGRPRLSFGGGGRVRTQPFFQGVIRTGERVLDICGQFRSQNGYTPGTIDCLRRAAPPGQHACRGSAGRYPHGGFAAGPARSMLRAYRTIRPPARRGRGDGLAWRWYAGHDAAGRARPDLTARGGTPEPGTVRRPLPERDAARSGRVAPADRGRGAGDSTGAHRGHLRRVRAERQRSAGRRRADPAGAPRPGPRLRGAALPGGPRHRQDARLRLLRRRGGQAR